MKYEELYGDDSITKIDSIFLEYLQKNSCKLYEALKEHRSNSVDLNSELLIDISTVLQKFLSEKFVISNQINELKKRFEKLNKIYEIRRNFVQRTALKKFNKNHSFSDSIKTLFLNYSDEEIDEIFIKKISDNNFQNGEYEELLEYAAYRVYSKKYSQIFSAPEILNYSNLINFSQNKSIISKNNQQEPTTIDKEFFEAKYCIKCHKNSKDSCRTGITNKDNQVEQNALSNILSGCPLNIKISEANMLYEQGDIISALAIMMLDNPLICLTGKRICNDCQKSCIFQKQTQVDVPAIESKIFEESMNLEYGFEIYSLLARWDPLNTKYFSNKRKSGNILVVGSGPAGIASSFYYLREGFNVSLIDGIYIKNLPEQAKYRIIKNYQEIRDIYQNIKPQGFGGVAEFGITDRWNKENLIITRLILERFSSFDLSGSVKFSANINYHEAIKLGYDHISFCCGSGYPYIPTLENINAGNIRTASDFLMCLGSGGVHFENSNTNFKLKLPIIILGGGLTAIDAATEAAKFYPEYVKRTYKKLDKIDIDKLNKEDANYYKIIKQHAEKYISEDDNAKKENREKDYIKITQELGGVKIIYRKNLIKSPAYRINHEEVDDALLNGVQIIENTDIEKINIDEFNNIKSLNLKINNSINTQNTGLLLVAAGTRSFEPKDPNLNSTNKVSYFGDMKKEYSGSVVKALASVKDNIYNVIQKIDSDNNNALNNSKINLSQISKSKIKNKKNHGQYFEIEIENKLISPKIKPGHYIKINIPKFRIENVAAHAVYNNDYSFKIYIASKGYSSEKITQLNIGDEISISGPLGNIFEIDDHSKTLLIAEDYRIYPFLKFKNKPNCEIIFNDEIDKKISSLEIDKYEKIFVNLSNKKIIEIFKFLEPYKDKITFSSNILMQCMMGGVCGQCFNKEGDKTNFLCKKHIKKLDINLIKDSQTRLKQNSFLEKIS